MRNLFSTKVKIILVVAALLTAALAIYSGMSSSYLKYLTNVFYDKQITGLDYTAFSPPSAPQAPP